jgi:hypothetical protein
MHYLDDRYQNIIGQQGLTRFVDQFPDFFDAIQEKVQQSYIVENHDETYDETYDETDGLAFLLFDVFGWDFNNRSYTNFRHWEIVHMVSTFAAFAHTSEALQVNHH